MEELKKKKMELWKGPMVGLLTLVVAPLLCVLAFKYVLHVQDYWMGLVAWLALTALYGGVMKWVDTRKLSRTVQVRAKDPGSSVAELMDIAMEVHQKSPESLAAYRALKAVQDRLHAEAKR